MNPRRAAMIVTVLAAAISVPACDPTKPGSDSKPGAENKGKSYDTPQAVFDAAKDAAVKEDWGTFMTCLTDDSKNTFTFMIAFGGMFVKGFAEMDKDKGKENTKAIDDAMAKHGSTEANFKKLEKELGNKKATRQEERETIRRIVEPIKDKAAFVTDVMAAMKKAGKKDSDEAIGGELKDLKID